MTDSKEQATKMKKHHVSMDIVNVLSQVSKEEQLQILEQMRLTIEAEIKEEFLISFPSMFSTSVTEYLEKMKISYTIVTQFNADLVDGQDDPEGYMTTESKETGSYLRIDALPFTQIQASTDLNLDQFLKWENGVFSTFCTIGKLFFDHIYYPESE